MKRLIYKEPNGNFGVKGIDIKTLNNRLYMIICKLKDYEDLGLSPDDVQHLIYKLDDLQKSI